MKKLFLKISKIYRKAALSESFLNRFEILTKKRFWYRCFPVNSEKIFKTDLFRNIAPIDSFCLFTCLLLLELFLLLNLFNLAFFRVIYFSFSMLKLGLKTISFLKKILAFSSSSLYKVESSSQEYIQTYQMQEKSLLSFHICVFYYLS